MAKRRKMRPMYPFKVNKIIYEGSGLRDTELTRKGGAYVLSGEEKEILEKCTPVLDLSKLRTFLSRHCNVQDPANYSWPDILAALERWLKNKAENTAYKTISIKKIKLSPPLDYPKLVSKIQCVNNKIFKLKGKDYPAGTVLFSNFSALHRHIWLFKWWKIELCFAIKMEGWNNQPLPLYKCVSLDEI